MYTHRHSVSNRTLETRTAQILEIINRRCEVSLTHLTHYAIENCPEELDDINEDRIATIRAQTRGQLTHLVNVARATENYSTANAVTVEEAKAKERNLSDQQGKAEIVKQNGKKEKDQSSWRTPGREWWKHPLRFVGGGIQGGIFASVGSFMAATVVFLAFTAAPEIMIPVAGAIKAAGGLTVIASSVAGAGAVVGGTLAVCAEDVEAPSMLIQYLSEDKK